MHNFEKAENEKPISFSRRILLGALGAMSISSAGVFAQSSSLLPLDTPGLDHLDIIVPDVAASAIFYMSVFNTTLHAQTLQNGIRYFVLFGELNGGREVSYLAIGESRGRGTYIGHFCTSVFNWRQDSSAIFEEMGQAIEAAGFNIFPGSTGFGGIFSDPDGIEIQFLPAPDTLVTAAVPSNLTLNGNGLVTPLGVDHVHLLVSDIERATEYYSILYGSEIRRNTGDLVYFDFPASSTHLVLEQADYGYGRTPEISHFGIKVTAFDQQTVEEGLVQLGATLLPSEESGTVRFRDLDGIIVELKAV